VSEENEEVERSEFKDWLGMRPGEVARKKFAGLLESCSRELDAACRESTDPKVRGAYEKKVCIHALCLYLSGKGL
jgi:hypothetical protein